MSRHPSPGPSHPASAPVFSSRQKQKPYTIGIAAGAEDVKYQAKYKDLKRKVKEIEADNDKLHFKVLQAKRSIQRMKLERAVLYERLSTVPPSPERHDRHALPTVHPVGPGVPPRQSSHSLSGAHQHHDHTSSVEVLDYRSHGSSRVPLGPDNRHLAVMDTPIGPGMAPSSHGLPVVHSPRRNSSGSAHELMRIPPPPSSLPSVQQFEAHRGHGHSHPGAHASPPLHHASHGSPHERSRSHSSSSRSRVHQLPLQTYHPGHGYSSQFPEPLPPVQHVLHSPPRRHEIHEYGSDSHGHTRHQTPMSQHSPPNHPLENPRSAGRIHNHQRMGPGTYLNRDDPHDRDRDRHRDLDRERDRERDWEREHSRDYARGRDISQSQHSPPLVHRSRQADYSEHHISSRMRDEQGYYHEASAPSGYAMLSRSGTPGSGSGSGSGVGAGEAPSRPDSRAQYYDHDRARSYRLRPVNQPNDDIDFVHEDGQSHSRDRGGGGVHVGPGGGGNFPPSDHSRPSIGPRKRSRNDMEVDDENDVAGAEGGPSGGAPVFPGSGRMEDRGSKRYHREHPHRGVDNQEG